MTPSEVAITVVIDLGEYEFKPIRLTTKYDAGHLETIKQEARQFIQDLQNVISFEIGEVYRVGLPQDKALADEWDATVSEFLEKYPRWQYEALWAEGIG
ncbi:MAG: hypothetical protein HY231_20935 [Acidobacteria bacterium]|nr:hypothetical protein [Acidobacteriota bacterium]